MTLITRVICVLCVAGAMTMLPCNAIRAAAGPEPRILPWLTALYTFADGRTLWSLLRNSSTEGTDPLDIAVEIILTVFGDLASEGPTPRAAAQGGTPTVLPIASLKGCPGAIAGVFTPRSDFIYAANGDICAYALDVSKNQASPVPGSPFHAGKFTSAIARDRSGTYLFATSEDSNDIAVFAIDPATGALAEMAGSPVATGTEPAAVAVDGTARYVYAANRGSDSVSAYKLDFATGRLTPIPGSPFATPARPWSIAADPTGKYVYVGATSVQAYRIDDATGALTPVGAPIANVGGIAKGVAVDPTGRFVYVTSGFANLSGVTAYAIGTSGTLAAINRVATGDNPLGVGVDPSGRLLYTADLLGRSISAFNIDPATGSLTAISGSPFAAGENPVGIAVSGAMGETAIANAGEYFAAQLGAGGGRPPYAWAIASGALPPGLTLDATTGMLRGIATSAGTYAFVAAVRDAQGAGASHGYTMTIKGTSVVTPVSVVEFYNASLDHYFITWLTDEIAKLDAGVVIKGWARTGETFEAYPLAVAGASSVCRFYIPPALGDSHFFGRGAAECAATGQKNPSFVLEDPAFMQLFLPDAGVCPSNTTPIYRVFSNRTDANHRYMTKKSIRDQMVAKGWIAEGDGPDLVVMCGAQ